MRPRDAQSAAVRSLDAVLAVGVLVLLLLGVAGALLFAYPSAAARLSGSVAASSPRTAGILHSAAGQGKQLIGRAEEGWSYRVAEPIRALSTNGDSRTRKAASPSEGSFERDCVSCHPEWNRKAVFSTVYFPHRTHSAEGIECGVCHEREGADRDRVPAMSTCVECHSQAKPSGDCEACHPPGSLFHGATIAKDRDKSTQCTICHPTASLVARARAHRMPRLPKTTSSCAPCHDSGQCAGCHPAAHQKPYFVKHASDIRQRRVSMTSCYRCHDARWCAMECHATGRRSQ